MKIPEIPFLHEALEVQLKSEWTAKKWQIRLEQNSQFDCYFYAKTIIDSNWERIISHHINLFTQATIPIFV